MGHADYLKLGDSNGICDQCGFKYKLSELQLQWDGLLTCKYCWDYRHPQELLRAIPDTQNPPENPRPEAADKYVSEGVLGSGTPLAQDPLSPSLANLILQENGNAIFLDL